MKPWREIAIPRADVLGGSFSQAEFAADLGQVHAGSAPANYQQGPAFFSQTYITEGMRRLLTAVAQRLAGKGGDPVIQLQTAFGGGKTHSMLAVWHLAKREGSLDDLPGIPDLIDKAGLMDVPKAQVAVLDGNKVSPGQPWKHGRQTIRTLWGELAWQLGGGEAYELLRQADETGTSPGKDVLRELLALHAPCVVLIDELVAYIRQFEDGKTLSGGSFDSNLSFIQALTEAVKQVPNAIILASLPESAIEVGSARGEAVLKALEKLFGRVQALWKPVATEEAFAIVRRRLFEPMRDEMTVNKVARAFADAYIVEGARLPAETQEGSYVDRLIAAYPIHPEVFDRLFEDWTTIPGFQRTRGVLKLMAKVIHRLWQDSNSDLMIMPASLPLADGGSRNELIYYLGPGWDPVIERDIDSPRAETTLLENAEPRFGQVNAARRVARTLFLGSAPSSASDKAMIRGMDRAHIMLGCLQPGQTLAVYSDALNRLADKLHYLNSSGDKASDSTRFWFDTRANLRREMEDRKRRFDEKTDVRTKIKATIEKLIGRTNFIDGVHVFTPHADVPDDQALRLVVLPTDAWHTREENRPSSEAITDYLHNNGNRPRLRRNRLLFLAADHGATSRLIESARVTLAWASIIDDINAGRLNIDQLQKKQAEGELRAAEEVLPRVARECYRWLLCPMQDDPTAAKYEIEAFALNTGGGAMTTDLERCCADNELVISTWSPIHLRERLVEFYWKPDREAAQAVSFFEDTLRYLYLPRLKSRDVLASAIRQGAASRDFFGIAYGKRDEDYEGFQLGNGMAQLDDTLLLIEPNAAATYLAKITKPVPADPLLTGAPALATPGLSEASGGGYQPGLSIVRVLNNEPLMSSISSPLRMHRFYGTAELPAATARMKFDEIYREIIQHLTKDPTASVKLTLEIKADFEGGAAEDVRRTVAENAAALKLKQGEWE